MTNILEVEHLLIFCDRYFLSKIALFHLSVMTISRFMYKEFKAYWI